MRATTPARANFGRELRLPVQLLSGCPPNTPNCVSDYIQDIRRGIEEIHEIDKRNTSISTCKPGIQPGLTIRYHHRTMPIFTIDV
ncbi:hypothetical protein K1T71_014463 [Dendrolimus kikuchii]|uniref:Uncharacterized protein n=1 Tax=Dendrolimus kikuchii TaxID=765133 RepID=A0ACC1CEB9_9NEOP|nr:hypothetical protein K1T71_014463 [Dendrolimus kikuchii]